MCITTFATLIWATFVWGTLRRHSGRSVVVSSKTRYRASPFRNYSKRNRISQRTLSDRWSLLSKIGGSSLTTCALKVFYRRLRLRNHSRAISRVSVCTNRQKGGRKQAHQCPSPSVDSSSARRSFKNPRQQDSHPSKVPVNPERTGPKQQQQYSLHLGVSQQSLFKSTRCVANMTKLWL